MSAFRLDFFKTILHANLKETIAKILYHGALTQKSAQSMKIKVDT